MADKSEIIQNGRLKTIEKAEDILYKANLSDDELRYIIAQLMGREYEETKYSNYRWSVDNQLDLLKNLIEEIRQ